MVTLHYLQKVYKSNLVFRLKAKTHNNILLKARSKDFLGEIWQCMHAPWERKIIVEEFQRKFKFPSWHFGKHLMSICVEIFAFNNSF